MNYGILVKGGGEVFEKVSWIDCVVFDKMGILMMGGEFKIIDVEIYGEGILEESIFLVVLKGVEENSSYLIVKVIIIFCIINKELF